MIQQYIHVRKSGTWCPCRPMKPALKIFSALKFQIWPKDSIVLLLMKLRQGWKNKFSSVAQSCLTLCNPMDCSMPGFLVHHQLLELDQTHVCQVNDAIQSSHPLPSPSPPSFNLSQHQGLFYWISSSHQWPKHQSFSFSVSPSNEYSGLIPLGLNGWISLQSTGLLNTTVQKHQFFGTQPSLWSNSHIHAWLLEKP